MKKQGLLLLLGVVGVCLVLVSQSGVDAQNAGSPINPCLNCHVKVTPDIVQEWENHVHSAVGIKCFVCHFASADDPTGVEHFNGFRITSSVSYKSCMACHAEMGDAFKDDLQNWHKR